MNYRFLICVWVVLWVTLTACSSSAPSRFYTLNSMPGMQPESNHQAGADSLTIGVGPVEVPAYLDRPQIVTRISPNEFKLAEFHRWAEPLKDSLTRVLVENLSNPLNTEAVAVFPWEGAMMTVDYQVVVEVIRFDGSIGDSATLVAQWYILKSESKKKVFSEKIRIEETAKGADVNALVAAQSLALENFSTRIATTIKGIIP